MKRSLTMTVLAALLALGARAQQNLTSADVYLGLRRLNTLGSVLYIAAHPDDENTRLLTYFSKDRLFRTGYLSLTRGDGGQNLIGDEQGIPLGLIRTQELLAARRIDGAEQFFSRAYDFGYSKTPQETFTKWDREKILADVVWTIRKFQPDVLITRFPSTGEGGHGHHTASAILANEAFQAAGDPKRFPEQLTYVQPWQPKRILWNTFNFGGNNTQREDQFRFDVGGYNPVLGLSYGEIAADSRSQHKSQGFGVPRSRGEALEYFQATGGATPKNDLFEDVDVSWKRVPGSEGAAALIQQAISSFDFLKPQQSVPALVAIHKALAALPAGYWRNQKLRETEALIEAASGLFVEAFTTVPNAVQGDSLRINLTVNNRLGVPMTLDKISVGGADSTFRLSLPVNRNVSFNQTLFVSDETPISQPYWLREAMEEGMFRVDSLPLIGQPEGTPAYTVRFELTIGGAPFSYTKPVQYKFTDPVKGEVHQPLFVIPAATISVTPGVVVLPKGSGIERTVSAQVAANRSLRADSLQVRLRGKFFNPVQRQRSVSLDKNIVHPYLFPFKAMDDRTRTDYLQPFANYHLRKEEGAAYLAMAGIHYGHIPTIRYFYPDGSRLLQLDLKTEGKRIGYIVGAGDKVPEALEQMGYEVTLLTERELARNNLAQFDAILSGVRAYNTNEWLNRYHDKLMRYVEAGGNLIVQYNTSSLSGPVRAKIGPYDFNISRTRVTDEASPVAFVQPGHPALNFPNKIAQDDFKGWVQERSIYHAAGWDPRFQPVLALTDPGEGAEQGSLIIAPHGRGFFTYTGLAFFRQLPAGVPGAYRLLANLIALNHKKAF